MARRLSSSRPGHGALVAIALAFGAAAALALPPIPMLVDGFECGSSVRWSATVGGTVPAGPPVGVMVPVTDCEWRVAPPGDPYPAHLNLLSSPLVAELPYGAAASREIVAVTYNGADGGAAACRGTDPAFFGVLRVFDGATCALVANLVGTDPDDTLIAAASPAIGDLDGDGVPEIVALRSLGGLLAFRWSPASSAYLPWWETTPAASSLADRCRWDGPVLHDLDDDGFPEVLAASEVYDGRTGARRDDGALLPAGTLVQYWAVADVDADGAPEIAGPALHQWDPDSSTWVPEASFAVPTEGNMAYADFGTETAPGGFDPAQRDGVAELVWSAGGEVRIEALSWTQTLLTVPDAGNGTPAVGDFDGDGEAEAAVGSGSALRVVDFDCETAGGGCLGGWVRWSQPIQDLSSGRSAAAAFDFDRDGRLEVAFADECFARVLDGATGDVLASMPRRSCTFLEGPAIADADGDGAAEIVVVSNANCGTITCPGVDPIHRGNRCQTPADCESGTCDAGYCRCTAGGQCPAGHACAAPPAGTPGSGDTCRATHPGALVGFGLHGESAGRWGASGGIWNQHPFSVTNVSESGAVPATSEWVPNFLVPGRNDFRAAAALCAP